MRSRDVRRVMGTGRKLHGERVVVALAPGAGGAAAVAGRRVGNAVERNRARRIMRAAIRELRPSLEAHDVVVVARPTIRGSGTNELVTELRELLRA